MGVLDELKRHAESKKQQQPAREQGEAQTLQSVHEALGVVSRYFNELANSLNVVKPEIARDFVVQGNACLQRLLQGEHLVRERRKTVDARDYFEQVTLRFQAVGQQPLALETYADHATDRLQNYLTAYGLRYETQTFRNGRGVTLKTTVAVLPDVPAAITATADWAAGTVRLTLRNVEAIGDAEYCYDPAEVDRQLLDELAKLVLSEPNGLRGMGRHQESLRMSIVARRVAPERESEPRPEPSAPEPEPRAGLFGGLKSLWKK